MPDRKYIVQYIVGGRWFKEEIRCSDGLAARDICTAKYGNCQNVLGPYN